MQRFKRMKKQYTCTKARFCFYCLGVILLLFGLSTFGKDPLSKPPPRTRKDNVTENLHGVEITDPYRWLEDQQSPETRAWINEQNEHTESVFASLSGRGPIERRLNELMKIDTFGFPRERGGRYFFARRRPDQDQFVLYMRKGLEDPDEVLVDPHPMSPDKTTSVRLLDISQDGT